MSSSTLYRFSGGALLIGGVLAIIGQLLQILADHPGTPLWIPGTWLALGGTLLVVLGWPGVYFRQVHRAGRLGLLGFVLSLVALLILVGIQTVDAFVTPALAASAATRPLLDFGAIPALNVFELLCGLLLVIGPFLFGMATIRAGVLPRWTALILIVGSVATLATVLLHNWNTVSTAILFLAIGCFGFVLWSNRDALEVVPTPPILKEAHN